MELHLVQVPNPTKNKKKKKKMHEGKCIDANTTMKESGSKRVNSEDGWEENDKNNQNQGQT